MLQASRFGLQEGQLIAGAKGGKKVRCSSQALPVYNDLVALADRGNYWAGMVVRGIRGLTCGRLSVNNVYLNPADSQVNSRGIFYLVLPGVTATLQSYAEDLYEVRGLYPDTRYMELQARQQKAGLWRISNKVIIDPEFITDGTILKKENRPVVISDPADDVTREAYSAREGLKKVNSTVASIVNNSGFDLHHTPGDGSLSGLKPAAQAISNADEIKITESAILLANTMYKARNTNGVLWFSHWGGSAVLTRAMQILQNQNIKLEKHAIFLDRPTTNSSAALKLAKELEITPSDGGKNVGFKMREIKGNHLSSKLSIKELGNVGAFGLSAAGAGFGIAGLLGGAPVVGGIVTVMGALSFVTTTVITAKKKLAGKNTKSTGVRRV